MADTVSNFLQNLPQDPSGDVVKRLLQSHYDPFQPNQGEVPSPLVGSLTYQGGGGQSDFGQLQSSTIQRVLAEQAAIQANRDAQMQIQGAGLGQAQQFYQQNQAPMQEELPSQGQYPAFNAPEIPNRPAPQQDQTSRMLSGLAAGLAPGFMAGNLLSQPIETALQNAQMVYQDRLGKYKLQYQHMQQQHEDEVAARNEEAKRLAYNATVRYNNEAGAYKKNYDLMKDVLVPQAQLAAEAQTGTKVDQANLAAKQAEAEQGLASEKIKIKTALDKSEQAAELRAAQIEGQNWRTMAQQLGMGYRNETSNTTRQNIAGENITSREKIAGEQITSREKIATNHDVAAMQRARLRADTSVSIANKRIAAAQSRLTGGGKLDPVLGLQLRGLTQIAKTERDKLQQQSAHIGRLESAIYGIEKFGGKAPASMTDALDQAYAARDAQANAVNAAASNVEQWYKNLPPPISQQGKGTGKPVLTPTPKTGLKVRVYNPATGQFE